MNRFLVHLNRILKDLRFLRRWRRFVLFWASVCVFVTTYHLILPAISVEKDNVDNVSGLYLEDAEVIDEDQYPNTKPTLDDIVTDAPIVSVQEPPNSVHEKSTHINELSASGDSYEIFVTYDDKAGIPDGAKLEVQEITQDPVASNAGQVTQYDEYIDSTSDTLGCDAGLISYARVFDISIVKDGEKIDPKDTAVDVRCELSDAIEENELSVVNFAEGADAGSVVENSVDGQSVEFAAEGSAVYVIVGTTIEKNVLASDGHNYKVTVTYGADSGIPEGAELEVDEVLPGEDSDAGTSSAYGKSYEEYVASTENALGIEEGTTGYIRLFDIKIVDKDDHSVKYQPEAGTAVDVRIELADAEDGQALTVVHFADGSEEGERVVNSTENGEDGLVAVEFAADGFSVYAVVDEYTLATATEISEIGGNEYYLSIDYNNGRYYFKNTINSNRITKTNMSDIDSASLYGFESIEDQFFLYTYNENKEKVYVVMNNNTNPSFSADRESASPFTVEVNPKAENAFYIYYTGSDGKKYAFWYNNDGFNGQANAAQERNAVVLTKPLENDAFGLGGKSFGIINNQNTVSGTALQASASNNNTRLSGKTMTVRTEPIKRTENVFVANNSNITMWTFRPVSGDQYHITAEVNGNLKYLRIDGSTVTLADEPDENCVITVEAGTGKYSGKYKFSCNGSALRLNGTTFDRVNDLTTNENANCWMNLAELSSLNDDDFVVYTAEKVSVSGTVNDDGTIDYDVEDGDQIIIYTRIWNESTLRYDYYAIDHDGMLVKAYESGDTISWVGSKVNTMLWDFTEYHELDEYGNDTGIPNYYYELQNAYSGKYIAPQVSDTEFLSDSAIGINLNGRRNGEYYTTVLAWDDPYYDYASLKVEDWQLTSAPISKADMFYFAVMKPKETENQLTTVATIDSEPFGITLKMQNYGNVGSNNRSQTQTDVLKDLTYNQWGGVKNLLQKYIADGSDYPVSTKTGRSLEELFNEALTVNNQFLLSTYQETGYFEYDSTQNFAHLITSETDPWYRQDSPSGGTYDIGDFVIYNQIASTTENTGDTRRHGQFFPYNDLTENSFITNMVNDTDIHGAALSSLDPRKGEKLYKLQYKNAANEDPRYVDFFFGMEMNASFMQSASGLDDWGHDLIFEFSGDDDFWLYIDDVLVLDLGGIHSALDGSVNFRTGTVIEQKGNGSYETTTLRARFETAYKTQYPDKTQDEVNEWLNGIFKDDGTNTGTVFKDYSGHTMKMYYMERGAGASNLHMRFNLAPYKNGEVLLEKEVSGTDNIDPDTVYPFQIYYNDGERPDNQFIIADQNASVMDNQSGEPITYQPTYEVNGITYENVFLLKAGQTASIAFRNEDVKYYFKECGMDTDVYDTVTANNVLLAGTAAAEDNFKIKDFPIEASTVAKRKKVIYNNHVNSEAQHSLTITKKLWKDFDKTKEFDNDSAEFRFRIYIGKEGEEYTVYNTGRYYVKDPEGNYCTYNNGFQSTGKTEFSELSTAVAPGEWKSEQEQATFHTSPGGMADKIPAGYSIEIPKLMDGTAFLVVERDNEIPEGYNLIDYERDSGLIPEGETANAGVINGKNEGVIINNQHGYGLTVNKVWSDADFMADHDEIYFAVYLKDGEELTLLEDTVRQLSRTGTSLRWFFPELASGKTLNDYEVYEVTLDGTYTVDAETGRVTLSDGCTVTKIAEGGNLTVGGHTNEHGYATNYDYTASYERTLLTNEEIENNVNARSDTVTNSRPGIRIVKTDLNGNALEGAVFSLVKNSDSSAKKSFTSDEHGLITVAYLTTNEEYTLTETAAPYRYKALIDSLTIKVDSDGKLYVNNSAENPSEGYYTVVQEENPTAEKMPTVTIKNMPVTLKAQKVDAVNNEAISGIHFELYRETKDHAGNPMPDYNPMDSFADLVTNDDGVIPKITFEDLRAGSYYLRETQTTTQYVKLDFDIRLTILQTGQVSVQKAVYSPSEQKWVFSNITDSDVVESDQGGNITLTIKNTPAKGVQILKRSDMEDIVLSGAEFALYKMDQIKDGRPKDGETPLLKNTTELDGTMNLGALDANTTYYLFETKAPDGYIQLAEPVVINTLSSGALTAYLEGKGYLKLKTIPGVNGGVDVIQITVCNSTGYALPGTGGPGPGLIYLIGAILTVFAGAGLMMRKRRKA